ncbi:uncharacterized protein LOC129376117 isoform X2 [Poeciliopsis prolifica]|uniref:uncharacterized protein LOC129376117 isoform X2 n=1 Tax=Poeciliopsis prolifica TaxID=188132 RepID=UPI002413B5A2|nr:uncharacterized protein LOC129376117 isoform X2 [Poeciliopsis prolifica]
MEMWLKSAIVALLTVAGAALVVPREHNIYLNTRENKVHVPLGSSLTLHCCIPLNKSDRCRVNYVFEEFNQTHKNPKSICCNTTDSTNCNSSTDGCQSTCKLFDISERKNGSYYCEVTVEIPVLIQARSNKTEVVFTSQKEENDQNENLWMWIAVGASSFVLVMTVLLVICVVQKRGCSRSIEEPVYVNTRMGKQSPRPMLADNPKSASSCQDLRTPISARRYEGRNQRYKY